MQYLNGGTMYFYPGGKEYEETWERVYGKKSVEKEPESDNYQEVTKYETA